MRHIGVDVFQWISVCAKRTIHALRYDKVRRRTETVVVFLHTQARATCYRGAVIDVVRKQATSMTQQQCLEQKRGS
jgi:hypothetical protein